MITRFCPTISKDMHIGHLINFYANFFYAKRNNGKFIIRCSTKSASRNDAGAMARNLEVFTLLAPNTEVCVLNPEAVPDLLNKYADQFAIWGVRLPVDKFMFKDEVNPADALLVPLHDHSLGVDTIIRGKDWSGEVPGESPQMSVMTVSVLKELHGKNIPVYYTPILTYDGQKISKTVDRPEHRLHTLLQTYTPVQLLAYVTYLYDGKLLDKHALVHYASVFDLHSICATTAYVFDAEMLSSIAGMYTDCTELYSKLFNSNS